MTEIHYLTRVPVRLLRFGLYVAEPDRPWTEVPVMFQGFTIGSEDELRTLQQHCLYVYVEEQRSEPTAYAALEKDLAEPATEGDARPGETDISAVLGTDRQPSKFLFQRPIQAAAAVRAEALDFLDRAQEDARVGRTLDSRRARGVVESTVHQVSTNASAAIWLTSLKKKDQYSSIHSVNVCVLTLAFGLYLGLRGRDLEGVGLGALLHDVGKVNQPPEILSKTAPLDADDWKHVRRHPDEGYDLVARGGGNMPAEALDIIRMHHERADGGGFPRGLKGDDFPYHARIVALVNLYDSLTSDRPYRRGRPADEVLQELYNERHQTYGPELVQQFIQCVGIYPIGSLVELDDGGLGVVVGSSPDNRLRPIVLLVTGPDGEPYRRRMLLNLAAEPSRSAPGPRRIIRVVNPAHYDIDVAGIVAFEFGVDF